MQWSVAVSDGTNLMRLFTEPDQSHMKAVAADLNTQWKGGKRRIHFISEYYNYGDVKQWLEEQGGKQTNDNLHDDFAITAIMLTVDPTSVRMKLRIAANKFQINGIDLAPLEKTMALGKKITNYRAEVAVKAIRAAITSAQ